MKDYDFTKLFFYRWRYVIGYSLVGVMLIAVLVIAGLYLPGGLSKDEMKSVVQSNHLSLGSLSTLAVANMPYYALQKASLHFLGAHDFTIKLPSLILALFSAAGLIYLLRRWFKQNIAVVASLLAITTGQFLYVAQNGSPSILYIVWPVALLLLGTLVTREARFRTLWTVLFFVIAALSLYTPLSIYPTIAMALAVILHPHLRNVIRRMPNLWLMAATLVAGMIIAPLVVEVLHDPRFALDLLGIPRHMPDLLHNLQTLLSQYFEFWKPSTTTLMTPVFGLGSTLIILLGIYSLIRSRASTQSYLIIIWILCLVPVLLLNPAFTTVTFIPAVLLLALGFEHLVHYWYRLFPRNPYARIAGLIPLTVLIVALISSGIVRYANGYYYNPETAGNFSKDLSLLPSGKTTLITTSDEHAFWQAIAAYRPGLTAETTLPGDTSSFVVTHNAHHSFIIPAGYRVEQIITTTTKNNADRFYLYKKVAS